ncbi:hypothetical protein B0H13DRAFT_1896459 [Mycena leptocephala]|nr:hypothetical protein B0H13DRAFT_1896459 [Mycena leptocephala]
MLKLWELNCSYDDNPSMRVSWRSGSKRRTTVDNFPTDNDGPICPRMSDRRLEAGRISVAGVRFRTDPEPEPNPAPEFRFGGVSEPKCFCFNSWAMYAFAERNLLLDLWIRHFEWAKTVHEKIGRSAYRAIRHRNIHMRKHGSFFASLSLALIQRQPRRNVNAFVTYSYQLGLVFFCLRHIRNYRSLRLNREPPVPSEFFCAPRLDSTTSTSRGREGQRRFHPLETSTTRGIRGSLKGGRKKAQCGGGGDLYYGAGVDWIDATLLKFSLPSTTDTNDSEERRGVELRKKVNSFILRGFRVVR